MKKFELTAEFVTFLSTLSLRRATEHYTKLREQREISIHALLAESDIKHGTKICGAFVFLSTLSLRRATWDRLTRKCQIEISIHALLAESDSKTPASSTSWYTISIHALLAESDV